MSAHLSGAWERQLSFPTWQQYQSPKAAQGIWTSRPSKFRLTSDRQLIRKARGVSDGFGNVLRDDARVMAKVMIERHLLTLPAEQQRAITPAQKWAMVDEIVSRLTSRSSNG